MKFYKKNTNIYTIAIIASTVIIIGGLFAVLALNNHVNALDTSKITKFTDNVKNHVNNLVSKISNKIVGIGCSPLDPRC